MKTGFRNFTKGLTRSLGLVFWMLIAQILSCLLMGVLFLFFEWALNGFDLFAAGGNGTSFLQWTVYALLGAAFWVAMGYFAPEEFRPGPVGAVIVLAAWTALSLVMCNVVSVAFIPQEIFSELLNGILEALGGSGSILVIIIAHSLLPAGLEIGLLIRKSGKAITAKAAAPQ